MKNKKVILGMSGGVDSSVAALLLKNQGYEVVGVFMKNFSDTKNSETGECSWREEKRMAQRICALLEIPLITIDYEKEYKRKVIELMFKDYARNLTPNPDVICNKLIKFPALMKKAKELKADFVATGHYARVRGCKLLKGKDKEKDQSYFLYELKEKDLSKIVFPVGDLTKEQVREIARKNKFPNWNKAGTSGICFVGELNMKKFLKKKISEKRGVVLSPEGEKIGTHPGAMYFTIGEKIGEGKGFKIDPKIRNKFGGKWYVAEKLSGNVLVIAPPNHPILKKRKVSIRNFHLINPKEKIPSKLGARIRHRGKIISGELKTQSGFLSLKLGRAAKLREPNPVRALKTNRQRRVFVFSKPVEGIAEGQSIVLYKGDWVVGGGEIRFR